MELKIAEVVVDGLPRSIDRIFHYEVPSEFSDSLKVGMRVEVPFGFGNRSKSGFVVGFQEKTDRKDIKPIRYILDRDPVFREETSALAKAIRNRYLCTFSEALRLFVPPGTMMNYIEIVALTAMAEEERAELIKNAPAQKETVELLQNAGGEMDVHSLRDIMKRDVFPLIRALSEKKIVTVTMDARSLVRDKTVTVYRYAGDEDPEVCAARLGIRSPAQERAISVLGQCERLSALDITIFAGVSRATITTLEKKGLIEREEQEVFRKPTLIKRVSPDAPKKLTEEQKSALDEIVSAIKSASGDAFLLHGVTGSGKTEVFMQAIEYALSQGKTALVLVPEIALTPQMTERFTARFGDKIAILHSALSMGERLDEWKRIHRGEASVVIGARSAVFAPLQNIGILIIDEEHETSYKSEMAPRYDAREVAKMRSEQSGAVLLLSSATPSLQTMYRAKEGHYRLLTLKKRIRDALLPKVTTVDMGTELRAGNHHVISRKLKVEIEENLKRKEQTILFLNRRGFSTFVSCRNCGYVMGCKHCNISLTYHSHTNRLKCHYCGAEEPNPTVCPECGSKYIRYFGAGTERIERDVRELFPGASVVRMDVDTTSGKGGHERVLNEFSEEHADILLGTQMVAKGLDYPDVTLVGVLAADTLLNIDDYRAAERTFDLITQVCGRAGRGEKPGRAIIQTYTVDSPILKKAANQDYNAFYDEEINYRKLFRYPPFCDIINIIVSCESHKIAVEEMRLVAAKIRGAIAAFPDRDRIEVFGPSEAPIGKIKNRYRMRMWIKADYNEYWEQTLQRILFDHYNEKHDAGLVVDVNPNSML